MVVSQVPGFREWYNIVYDETVHTNKLLDDMKKKITGFEIAFVTGI